MRGFRNWTRVLYLKKAVVPQPHNERLNHDPQAIRYGCFLPDLTGLANVTPVASLPPLYIGVAHAKGKRFSQSPAVRKGLAG